MRELQANRRPRRLRRLAASRPVQMFLALILILVGESVFRLYQHARAVGQEEQLFQRELASLEARRAELAAEVAALATDRGVEEAIRDRFGVVKEGERVINLVGVATTITATTSISWWQKIVDWIK